MGQEVNPSISLRGRPVVGFGQAEVAVPAAAAATAHSPLTLALAGGVAAAATGWVIEEVWSTVWGRKRER